MKDYALGSSTPRLPGEEKRLHTPRPPHSVCASNLLVLFGLLLLWSWIAQNFSPIGRLGLDTLAFLGAFLLVWFGLRLQKRAGAHWAPAVIAAIGAWLALSVLEPLSSRSLPRNPERFSHTRRVAEERSLASGGEWPAKSVGIALSGGGYRAATYHAGVLDALDRLGVPVTNVSAVSGGSIIGSFYALGGEPLVFRDALGAGSFNLRRRLVLAQNLLRLPFRGFDRRVAQADLLRRRLDLADAERTHSTCAACPRLVVGATDLNFGMHVGFLDQGLLLALEAMDWSQHHADVAGLEQLDLADRVAISGAFPGAFPPRQVQIETRRQAMNIYEPEAERIRRTVVLADGGISDNTGLVLLRAAQERATLPPSSLPGWNVEFIVVSDAGAIFGLGGEPGMLSSLQRAIDVASARGSEGFRRRQRQRRDLLWLSPQSNFLPIPMLFDSPYRELSPEVLASAQRSAWFSPFAYPPAILEALGEVLLGKQEPARKELAEFSAKRDGLFPYPASDRTREIRAISNLLSHSKTREECTRAAPEVRELAANPELGLLACDAVRLRAAFRDEIDRLSLVFRDTPTLRDQLGPRTTHDLFALGQAETLLSWPRLGRLLNRTDIGPPPTLPRGPAPGRRLPSR